MQGAWQRPHRQAAHVPNATVQQSRAVSPSAGCSTSTGSLTRTSHTRTQPSRPQVAISGAPEPTPRPPTPAMEFTWRRAKQSPCAVSVQAPHNRWPCAHILSLDVLVQQTLVYPASPDPCNRGARSRSAGDALPTPSSVLRSQSSHTIPPAGRHSHQLPSVLLLVLMLQKCST